MACSVGPAVRAALALAMTLCAACGGGGGGGNPAGQRSTTFIGNLTQPGQRLTAPDVVVLGAPAAVQVCIADTSFCTDVDETGAFTLAADVGGDVVLVFEGPSFSARLALDDVPFGATVRIDSIDCSLLTGECSAENVDIISPLNTPPDCSAATASPAELWPPNHEMVPIDIVGVVDADGDPLVITATDGEQSEDDPGSGNTAPDIQLDPLAVRAERSGQGDGRVYTIFFSADDGRGGTCEGVVEVCVPHDQGRNTSCG